MTYRIFRYDSRASAVLSKEDLANAKSYASYEWVGDSSGFAEGTSFRPDGMSESESAIRSWFKYAEPVPPGYYVAVPWDQTPTGFTVKAQELIVT